MLKFENFVTEVWSNRIPPKRDPIVSSSQQFDQPTSFMRNAEHLGSVGSLNLYSSSTAGGGMTHFTWSPKDKKIHHVLYSANATPTKDNGVVLKYLSAHGRKNSPVKMSDVYTSLVNDHNRTMVATSHSPGAQSMWSRFHDNPDLQVHGFHKDTNELKPLSKEDPKYVQYGDKEPQNKRLGNMRLVLSKAGSKPDPTTLS